MTESSVSTVFSLLLTILFAKEGFFLCATMGGFGNTIFSVASSVIRCQCFLRILFIDLLQSEYFVARTSGLFCTDVGFCLCNISCLCSNLMLLIIVWIRLLLYPLLTILFLSVLVIVLNVSFLELVLRYLIVSPLVIPSFQLCGWYEVA